MAEGRLHPMRRPENILPSGLWKPKVQAGNLVQPLDEGMSVVSKFRIDPKLRHVAEEFRRRPVGKHGPDLQRVLNVFRGERLEGKFVLVCTKPHREWVLGQLSGKRGDPVKLLHNQVFHSLEDAEWEVFKQRWYKYTGEHLEG